MQMVPEKRSYHGELRAIDDEGIIEGYATVWNTVDSYDSTFQRGAFTKTLQERSHRVKILWNHEDTVIGKPLEIREDDKGLFVRAQLILSVPKAREVYELVKAGAIDTFSFGFRTIKDKWVNSVRTITEVMLMEISPVIFEANQAAVITGVRNMDNEERSKKYMETYGEYELMSRGDLIMTSLHRTLNDIWYGSAEGDDLRSMIDGALSDFTSMYSAYTSDLLAMSGRDLRGSKVQIATRKYLSEVKMTPEQLAASTVLTIDEVRSLLDGKPAVDQGKMKDLPEEVVEAIKAERASKVQALCDELRSDLTQDEIAQIKSILPKDQDTTDAIIKTLAEFRSSLSY